MDVSSCDARLFSRLDVTKSLPADVLQNLHAASNHAYLDALSDVATRPAFTNLIFSTHADLFVEICGRWLISPKIDKQHALFALAKILPIASHLAVFAKALLNSTDNVVLKALSAGRPSALQDLETTTLHNLLLSLYRLLEFDNTEFAPFVSPAQIHLLLKHASRPIRYLAIRILCLYMHATELSHEQMVKTYLSEAKVEQEWEDRTIDYSFLSFWETQRLLEMKRASKQHNPNPVWHTSPERSIGGHRVIGTEDLTSTSAYVGGVLVPVLDGQGPRNSSFVTTQSSSQELQSLGEKLKCADPVLLTGPSGSGKTALVRHVARILGKERSMIITQLNEQLDAKTLIGMHTTATTPGSFAWQPGILTRAVLEGRWILVENLNRAPVEILSVLLSLLERRELFVPHWGESVPCHANFRIIATATTSQDARGRPIDPSVSLIGRRLWSHVKVSSKSEPELAKIVTTNFDIPKSFMVQILAVFNALKSRPKYPANSLDFTNLNPSYLFRWCARVEKNFAQGSSASRSVAVPESVLENNFLDAVDIFTSFLPSNSAKSQVVEMIARQLGIPPNRIEHCLHTRVPSVKETASTLSIGRVKLIKKGQSQAPRSSRHASVTGPFATTDRVSRALECIAVATKRSEPCLLVGETGTGKTTLIQKLSTFLNHSLTVINLSQQSEASDLFGGFKPVSVKMVAFSLKEDFVELLRSAFPSKSNQRYLDTLQKAVYKGRWSRVLALWREAIQNIESHFKSLQIDEERSIGEPLSKRRKTGSSNFDRLNAQCDKFRSDVQAFEALLSGESKGFAFSFVEGNLVKAARNGDWVLLDEINLASQDTLESLSSLICHENEGQPSLILSDSGNIDRIYAHKDFRIFAAMNPATDTGKRELPTSIRSRFTEIYIDAADTDIDSLILVIKAYLGTHCEVDVRVANDVALLHMEIRRLSEGNVLADGANQKTHFSLRTLARTLAYATEIAPVYGLRRAMYEGFCMSYLTVLDRKSEDFVKPLIDQHILSGLKNRKGLLSQLPRLPTGSEGHVQFRQYWVHRGPLPIERNEHFVITPFVERNLLNLVRATCTRKFPILLQGPTSTGKTSMVEHLAKVTGHRFIRINNHEHTDLQEYLGTYVSDSGGQLYYQDGLLVQALKQGHWVVLDELNLAPTDVLEALNRLLDDNRELLVPETQQLVRPHRDFMLFATQNPPGLYGGRKTLSRAFRNRFLELHFDEIPESDLETILRERSRLPPSYCAKIVAVFKRLSILRQSLRVFEQKQSFATLRDLFRWARREADDKERLALNGFLLLAEKVRDPEERNLVKEVIQEIIRVQIPEEEIYGLDNFRHNLGPDLHTSQGLSWTKSMRRLYTLVSHAVKNREPVLLVGDTGCGKTSVCQMISRVMNVQLHIVNGHQNMETSDLIGAQRPVRDRTSVQSEMRELISTILQNSGSLDVAPDIDTETLLEKYRTAVSQTPEKFSPQVLRDVEKAITKAKALFEWSDGSIVQAMRKGHHYLLDEISLADDSVLERLNSVLESDRSLLLAEKGSDETFLSAAPDFQFFATMNPGGDYGKRELSPALRNRFTEIWVPPIFDEEDFVEIVRDKLRQTDKKLAAPLVRFATWYATNYRKDNPQVSIRDLISWTLFINARQDEELYFAILNGAAMIYIDRLGANPAGFSSTSHQKIAADTFVCVQQLSALFKHDMARFVIANPRLLLNPNSVQIGPFSVPKHSSQAVKPSYSLEALTTKINLLKIARALQVDRPILLEGPPGVGKTTLISALADIVGIPLTRVNLSGQTDLMDLFGSDVPVEGESAENFNWRTAPFLQSLQAGHWVLLDEMNLASQSVLEGLNACLDHRGQVYISELDKTFSKHPGFKVFAAQNPYTQGGGRKGLPASFVDRFTIVYTQLFSYQDLLTICRELQPGVPSSSIVEMVQATQILSDEVQQNKIFSRQGSPWEINLRDALRWLQLVTSKDGLLPISHLLDTAALMFVHRFRTSEQRAAARSMLHIETAEGGVDRYDNYSETPSSIQLGLGHLAKSKPLRTNTIKRTLINNSGAMTESILLCVRNRWPCLLVGSSGSGKTTGVRYVGAKVGADIVSISMNPEMDATDLLGGFDQVDRWRKLINLMREISNYTAQLVLQSPGSSSLPLLEILSTTRAELKGGAVMPPSELLMLTRLIEEAAKRSPSTRYDQFLVTLQTLLQSVEMETNASFEWVDGVIVTAVETGKWLILENANLCSPAILDRLNSLLEPDGFLSIDECPTPDDGRRVVMPHPDFRLFLTVDPCHGELSRAMRNRAFEVFLPGKNPPPEFVKLTPECDYLALKFQVFQLFDWVNLDEALSFYIMLFCLDHLRISDLPLLDQCRAQVASGLLELSPSKLSYFSSAVQTFLSLCQNHDGLVQNIQNMHGSLGPSIGSTDNLKDLQVSALAQKSRT